MDAAKKNPGGIKLANAGVGTGQHLLGAAFQKITGTRMLEVPYRGSSAVFPDHGIDPDEVARRPDQTDRPVLEKHGRARRRVFAVGLKLQTGGRRQVPVGRLEPRREHARATVAG